MNEIANTNHTGASPFDAIRKTREDGAEFWSARDLMPLLGYDSWRRFADAIERAKLAAGAQGHEVSHLFAGAVKKSEGGRPAEDYELARFAAYLVAMNGDPRKTAVANAQAYFAVKTREAEVAAPLRELTPDEIVHQALQITTAKVKELAEANERLALEVEHAGPAVRYHEKFICDSDASTVSDWARQHGLTGPKAYDLLVERGVVFRKHIMDRWSTKDGRKVAEHEYRARAGWLAFFDLRPQHNAPRHHNGQVRQTLYVKAGMSVELAIAVGLHAQEEVA